MARRAAERIGNRAETWVVGGAIDRDETKKAEAMLSFRQVKYLLAVAEVLLHVAACAALGALEPMARSRGRARCVHVFGFELKISVAPPPAGEFTRGLCGLAESEAKSSVV
jgi:hypothetical protein